MTSLSLDQVVADPEKKLAYADLVKRLNAGGAADSLPEKVIVVFKEKHYEFDLFSGTTINSNSNSPTVELLKRLYSAIPPGSEQPLNELAEGIKAATNKTQEDRVFREQRKIANRKAALAREALDAAEEEQEISRVKEERRARLNAPEQSAECSKKVRMGLCVRGCLSNESRMRGRCLAVRFRAK